MLSNSGRINKVPNSVQNKVNIPNSGQSNIKLPIGGVGKAVKLGC